MMRTDRESSDFVVLPIASETTKQSIESPIPVRTWMRKSMCPGVVVKEAR